MPTYPLVFKKNETHKELARESLVLCQFFHENLWCFKVFEIMGTDGPLILIFSKELAAKTDFGIFTELKPFKIQRTTRHCYVPRWQGTGVCQLEATCRYPIGVCQLEATCRYPIGVNDSNSLLTSHFLKFPQSVALEYPTMPHLLSVWKWVEVNNYKTATCRSYHSLSISSFYAHKERSQVATFYMRSPGIRLWVLSSMEWFT